MSQQESDGSSVVPGKEPWERVRHFTDGRAPVTEWQCAECQAWFPPRAPFVMTFASGGRPEMWCTTCRPPKVGALKHLEAGGSVLFGYGGFTEWIKKNAAERARGGHGQ